MDYGKYAYQKAEELARRIDALERKNTAEYGTIQVSSASRRAVEGSLLLTRRLQADADGAVALILRLRLFGAEAEEIVVTVSAQDCVAATERYTTGKGRQDVFLTAGAAVVAGEAEIRIVIEGETVLEGYDLTVFGKGLRGADDAAALSTAGAYACVRTAGRAVLYDLAAPSEALGSVLCDEAVLCETEGRICLYFCDRGTAWRTSGGYVEFVADGVTSALGTGGATVAIAEGSVYELSDSARNRIPAGTEAAAAILPVARTEHGAFILRTERGRLYYKERMPSTAAATIGLGGRNGT